MSHRPTPRPQDSAPQNAPAQNRPAQNRPQQPPEHQGASRPFPPGPSAPHQNADHGSPQHPALDGRRATWEALLEQRIRERAYELYCARGRGPGRAEDDWRQAELDLRGMGRPAGDR